MAAEQQEKEEREKAAMALRAEERAKVEALVQEERARIRVIKKEMAADTKKQKKDEEAAAKVRYEKSMAERAAMVKHLLMDTKLRDEDEIANEVGHCHR